MTKQEIDSEGYVGTKNLEVLTGDGSGGAPHLAADGSDRATDDGFSHVHEEWYKQTLDFEEAQNIVSAEEALMKEFSVTVNQLRPEVADGKIVLAVVGGAFDGIKMSLTRTSLAQLTGIQLASCGSGIVERLTNNEADEGDIETARQVVVNGLRHVKPDREVFVRLRVNGTTEARALLSERYASIKHSWLLKVLAEGIPGGRVSHLRFTGDYLRANILIPDTLRDGGDSRYGGMLAFGNDEVGKGRQFTLPSIFRDICYNGCIWGEVKGQKLTKVHRGKIDLEEHEMKILYNLKKQIPLLPTGINKMLSLKALEGQAPVEAMVAQVAMSQRGMFSKKQAASIVAAYQVEKDLQGTAHGFVNALTRAAQDRTFFDGFAQETVELMAGSLLNSWTADDGASRWNALLVAANAMEAADVERYVLAV